MLIPCIVLMELTCERQSVLQVVGSRAFGAFVSEQANKILVSLIKVQKVKVLEDSGTSYIKVKIICKQPCTSVLQALHHCTECDIATAPVGQTIIKDGLYCTHVDRPYLRER